MGAGASPYAAPDSRRRLGRRREAGISSDRFWLRTLGELALYRERGDDEPLLRGAKPLGLTAFLALAPDRSARRPYLARLLWPEGDRSSRLRSLRQALYYLTDRADRDFFRRDDGTLTLRTDRIAVDLWAFDAAVERGGLERAVDLYGGPFLEGFDREVSDEFRHWREAENERVWGGLKAAYRQLVADRLASGEPDEAVEFARQYRDLNPLEEKPRRVLVRALVVAGREVEAFQEYQQYCTLLEEELGEEPSGEFEARAREVRELMIRERAGGAAAADGGDGDGGEGGTAGAEPVEAPEEELLPLPARAGGPNGADGGWPVRPALAALAAAVAVLAAALWNGGNGGASSAFGGVSADVLFERAGTETQWRLQLREGELAAVENTGRPARARPRPAGTAWAAPLARASGLDVALVDAGGADTVFLTDRPHDEHPLAWSPDGRRLLVDVGAPRGDGRSYHRLPAVMAASSGARRRVGAEGMTDARDGDWSPYGVRFALEAGRRGEPRDVWVLRADGTGAANVSDHPAADGHPAFSPEANWVAFDSRRTGDREVFVVRPDGSELRQVTHSPADDRAPVWLSPEHLAFVSDRGGGSDLWATHLPTGERRRLTDLGDVTVALRSDPRLGDRWVDSVAIRPAPERVAPGEVLELGARVRDAAGRPHAEASLPVRWRALEGPAARGDGPGRFRVSPGAEGRLAVGASLGGWRADTLRAEVRRLAPRASEVLLSESWERRPFQTAWVPFGVPSPALVEDTTGRYGAVLTSRGDEHFDSGAFTARAFPLDEGLTVEVWGRAPFTRPLYQNLRFGLFAAPPERDEATWRTEARVAFVSVSPDPPSVGVRPGLKGDPIAGLAGWSPEDWHRYTLQVCPDGSVWLLVDGRLRHREPEAVDPAGAGPVHLVLYGRSRGTEVVHGPVRVYRGARYRFAGGRTGESAVSPDGSEDTEGDQPPP